MCPGSSSTYNAVPLAAFTEFGLTGISPLEQSVRADTPARRSFLDYLDSAVHGTEQLSRYREPSRIQAEYQHPDNTGYSVMLDDLRVTFQTTPEPDTWVLLGTGLLGLIGYAWLRRHLPGIARGHRGFGRS